MSRQLRFDGLERAILGALVCGCWPPYDQCPHDDPTPEVKAVAEAVRGWLSPEYRNVGKHDWEDGFCRVCGAWSMVPPPTYPRPPCPSKRERRLVGPWEPVTEEAEG